MAITEIPQAAALLVILSTVFTWLEGDFDGASGIVSASIAGLVLVALLTLTARGLRAGPAVDAVVREHDGRVQRHPARRLLRPLLFPFPWRPRSVERTSPLRYGEHRRRRLDVNRSKDPESRGPVLVYFHGAATPPAATGTKAAHSCTISPPGAGCASAPPTGSGPGRSKEVAKRGGPESGAEVSEGFGCGSGCCRDRSCQAGPDGKVAPRWKQAQSKHEVHAYARGKRPEPVVLALRVVEHGIGHGGIDDASQLA